MAAKSYKQIAVDHAKALTSGKIKANKERILAGKRFLEDLKRKDLVLRTKDADLLIGIIEKLMVHRQGEATDGTPLMNKPLVLQPWQIFVAYNLTGFYYKGTNERRYKEAFIFLPRKNGKTMYVAALAFGLSIVERKSGAKIYIAAASLKQAQESFEDILYTLRYRGMDEDFRIRDNNAEHSVNYVFRDDSGEPVGSIDIEALAANPKRHDSLNSNIQIVDELHAVTMAQYTRFKESGKAYSNKLCIGISTAGDNANSFCYRRQEYGKKVLEGAVEDDSLFVFIAKADADENGDVDYTSAEEHEKANPSYGVIIRPEDIMRDALQAQNDPQMRKDFLSRSLNIWTTALKAYFDIEEFRRSDERYKWSLQELASLPIEWYGGADLSRMHDLTAAALFGNYEGVDIIITHGFFPVTQAAAKAEKDNIPLFGWADDGWITLCNQETVNMADIVNWFQMMRKMGFKIVEVGHDRKFAGEEYFPAMKKAGFKIVDQPQYFYVKSQGFRHIERAAKNGALYYMHSEAYEYCVSNVHAVEKTDDAVQYEKMEPTLRIDLFDASVFACVRHIDGSAKRTAVKGWFGE